MSSCIDGVDLSKNRDDVDRRQGTGKRTTCRHSGAPCSGEPGIHNHYQRVWLAAFAKNKEGAPDSFDTREWPKGQARRGLWIPPAPRGASRNDRVTYPTPCNTGKCLLR